MNWARAKREFRTIDEWLAIGGELKRNCRGTEYVEMNGDVVAKTCTTCKKLKDLDGFRMKKNAIGGRTTSCKSCLGTIRVDDHIYEKTTYMGGELKINPMGTAYYENANGEIVAKRCTKCDSIKVLKDYAMNKKSLGQRNPICRSCRSDYYMANQEHVSNVSRKWRTDNADHVAERKHNWKIRNREHVAEKQREWWRSNPDKVALRSHRRRARKMALPDDLTGEQQTQIISLFNGGCALTGSTEIHLDHVIPIVIGHGGTTVGNMIPLRSDLNLSKQDANFFDWFNKNKDRYKLDESRFDELVKYLADTNGMTTDEYRDYVYWCHENPQDVADL